MITNYTEMEKKWQKRWADVELNCAKRDGRPKFMVIFAYPGVTGYLHVGHMRGFSYADAIGRYKRMTGYNVLFPVGTHATGNGSISLANRIKKGDEGMIDYMKRQTVGATGDDTVFVVVEPQNVKVSADKKSYTQAQGYTFTTYTASEFQKMQVSAHQYITDCADGKTATYVIIYGNVVPGDTGTVTLTTLTNATVTGLELNVEKKVNVGEVSYNVTISS